MPIPEGLVEGCIDSGIPDARDAEETFREAYEHSLAGIDSSRRGRLAPATGHIAESVAAALLADSGWIPIIQFVTPLAGGHGIDLAMLTPDSERVFAVEVKGTLQERRWPRLSRRGFEQMSPAWLDKADNPGMAEQGLSAHDLSGLILLFQFRRRRWKAAATADFVDAVPITDIRQLDDPTWLV
jgi:hypothetical protein